FPARGSGGRRLRRLRCATLRRALALRTAGRLGGGKAIHLSEIARRVSDLLEVELLESDVVDYRFNLAAELDCGVRRRERRRTCKAEAGGHPLHGFFAHAERGRARPPRPLRGREVLAALEVFLQQIQRGLRDLVDLTVVARTSDRVPLIACGFLALAVRQRHDLVNDGRVGGIVDRAGNLVVVLPPGRLYVLDA